MRGTMQFSLRALLICVTLLCVLMAVLGSWFKWGDSAGKLCDCRALRLNAIALACLNYEAKNGTLPPAYISDERGKPMHSWRVLLLPYLERDDLYSRYDFSEPWNGPNNSKLAQYMPDVYRCPAYRGNDRSATNYVAVVGPQTTWRGSKGVALSEITDGTTRTILIVEVADSDFNWMEPRDISYEEALRAVNVDTRHGISSYHTGGACCGFVWGGSVFIPNGTNPDTLKALLSISGGERVPEEFYLQSDGVTGR